MSDKATVNIKMTRSDGYSMEANSLSYEAGLAISTIINRDGAGLPVTVSWEDDGKTETVEVPGNGD